MPFTVRLLFLISLFLSLNLQAECLKKGKIQFIKNKKKVFQEASYCFEPMGVVILNETCFKNKKCDAYQKYFSNKMPLVKSKIGNPLHHKCYLLGGKPYIVEVKKGAGWKRTSLCFFDDGSFISVFNRI